MSYEPLGDDQFDTETIPVSKPRRRRRGKSARGGSARTVGIVALVLLVVAIAAVAIALPIVLTRRSQQNAASNPNGRSTNNRAGAPVTAAQSDNPALNGFGAVNPVGPNLNTGDDVFCYESVSSGSFMDGAFRKTGEVSEEDGLSRSEVQSCGSGAKMFVLTSQLKKCDQPCRTPVWMAVHEGIIKSPIWEQQYVCRGDQVYVNRKEPRYSFYFRFAGFVQEQLITRCDSDDAWWVPNGELRFCTPKETVSCEMTALNRKADEGEPKFIKGVPAGTATAPRPVCVEDDDKHTVIWYATGAATNAWDWLHFRFMDQLEVVPCNNRTSTDKKWKYVKDQVPCPSRMAAACDAGGATKSA